MLENPHCEKCNQELEQYSTAEDYKNRKVFVCVNHKCKVCGVKVYVK